MFYFGFFIFMYALLLPSEKAQGIQKPNAIDLSQVDWEKGPVTLRGPWEFYWQKLLEPGESGGQPSAITNTGISWNGLVLEDGRIIESYGYATYRLQLKNLQPHPKGYQIALQGADSAFKLIVFPSHSPDEWLSAAAGLVLPENEIPSKKPAYVFLTPTAVQDYTILLQVSNRVNHMGGAWQSPEIGLAESVRERHEIDALINFMAAGIMLAVGVYSFMMWVRRRQEAAGMYLGLAAFLMAARALSMSPMLAKFLSDSFYGVLRSVEYASIFGGGAFSLFFLLKVFRLENRFLLIKKIGYLGVLLFGLILVLPNSISSKYLLASQAYAVLTSICFFVIIIAALRKDMEGSRLILVGTIMVVFAFFFDIFSANNIFGLSFFVTPPVVAIFVLLQSQLVAQQAAHAYKRAENLAIELVEKEKARTLFFHNTSHELRTPLNGIIGFLDLVHQGRYGTLSEMTKAPLEKSLRLAEALKNQVNTILDLAKSRRGELQLRRQVLSLNAIMEEADHLAEGLQLRSSRLSYQSSLHVAEGFTDFIGDYDKIVTIIRNLLGNAFKFVAPDRNNHVELKVSYDHQGLMIQVIDTGIGIPAEYQSKIFDEFAQVQGDARRSYEGTGLGLTMVQGLVRLMNGAISVDSSPELGSSFSVLIPSQKEAGVQAAEESLELVVANNMQTQTWREVQVPLQNEVNDTPRKVNHIWKILVIDDNAINCEVICEILKAEGYDVESELSGRTGLLRMRKQKPHLLLLDMMMPEMSGEDVFKVMLAEIGLREIPVILITARASEEDRIAGLKLGADDYLAKPILAAELLLRVRNMLERHQLLREVERQQSSDKLIHMGTLFADLSHEIKNILNGASNLTSLHEPQIRLAFAPIGFKQDNQQSLIQSIYRYEPSYVSSNQWQELAPLVHDELLPIRESLRALLLEGQSDRAKFTSLWEEVQKLNDDEVVFLENQLRILAGYQIFARVTERTTALALSVLNYTRESKQPGYCQLQEVWREVRQLSQSRSIKTKVNWEVDLENAELSISANHLTQILLNLVLNAFDALLLLPVKDRWIRISMKKQTESTDIFILNAGSPIPEETHSAMFERGFSTKGRNGSGIGLSVSKRLAQQAGGDLVYVTDAEHPCFKLKIKNSVLS